MNKQKNDLAVEYTKDDGYDDGEDNNNKPYG